MRKRIGMFSGVLWLVFWGQTFFLESISFFQWGLPALFAWLLLVLLFTEISWGAVKAGVLAIIIGLSVTYPFWMWAVVAFVKPVSLTDKLQLFAILSFIFVPFIHLLITVKMRLFPEPEAYYRQELEAHNKPDSIYKKLGRL